MSRPAFLVDNLLSPRSYPGHTLAASSTDTGTSVRSLSAGRRRRDLSGWKASTLNTAAYVRCTFDQPRMFNCLWIDRDHNLATESVNVAMSDDGWTTELELTAQTVPSVATPNARLYSGNLLRTDEGALLWYLGDQAAHEIEVRFPAMGTGLRPELAGLMLGQLWAPEHAPEKPFDWLRPTSLRQQHRDVHAQWTEGGMGSYRNGTLRIKCGSFWEAEIGALHIEDLYGSRGRGMVTIPDDEAAERAVFHFSPPGEAIGFMIEPGRGWSYPQTQIPIMEEDPVIR